MIITDLLTQLCGNY